MTLRAGRPIAGHVNLSPARINTAPTELSAQVGVVSHEIAHALGFSGSKLPFFRKPGTLLPINHISEVLRDTRNDPVLGKRTIRLISPKVAAAAKAQYNCYSWPDAGMELEDYGGSGTAGSHWEKRLTAFGKSLKRHRVSDRCASCSRSFAPSLLFLARRRTHPAVSKPCLFASPAAPPSFVRAGFCRNHEPFV